MTGSNKVWRAPIAGLASVAMLATLGVTAMTANAADKDVKITFQGNGLMFNTANGLSETLTVNADKDGSVLDEAAEAFNELQMDGATFTGWFDGNGAVVDAARLKADPDVKDDESLTLTAHWTAETPYSITLAGNAVNDYSTFVAPGDALADWQVPADKSAIDGHLFTGVWTAEESGAEIDPTDANAYAGAALQGTRTITLKAGDVASSYVTFKAADLWKKGRTVLINNAAEDVNIELATGTTMDAAKLELPTATFVVDNAYRNATKFLKSDKKTEFTTSTVVNEPFDVYPAELEDTASYKVTFTNGDDTKTQMVAEGDTAAKPADPSKKATSDKKYEFAGWYEAGADEPYDFSKPVSAPVSLTAYYVVSDMKVTFNLNYPGSKDIEQWYGNGDVFEAPDAGERDGYHFNAWKNAPADGTKLTLKSTPAEEPTGNLGYYISSEDGENAEFTNLATYKFVADWGKDSEAKEKLAELEAKVSIAADSDRFTESSFKQYQSDWQDYLAKKAELAKKGYTVDEYAELIKMLKAAQAKLVELGDTDMIRLYNPNNGDHLYTSDSVEIHFLQSIGWTVEGPQFKVVKYVEGDDANNNKALGVKVTRLYNPYTGEHLLSSDSEEATALKKAGWNIEGPAFYAPQNGFVSVTRLYNPFETGPGAHLYTSDENEIATLVSLGWRVDGLLCNAQ